MIPGSIDEIDDERAGDMGLDLDRSRIGPVSSVIEAGKLKAHLDARPTLQAKIMRNIIVSLDHDLLQVKEIIKTLYTRRNNAK